MPMRRELYPPNWEEIALSVKQAAHWHCEACGKPCLMPGEDWLGFVLRMGWTVGEAIERYANPKRYELDAAHPHHDPENLDADIRAWCNPCHCRYDLRQMSRKRMLKRERDGQLTVFHLAASEPAGHGKDPARVQLPIKQEVPHAT